MHTWLLFIHVCTADDHSNETVESFYEDVQKAKELCKRHDVIIMMGNLNAKVGKGRLDDIPRINFIY